MPLTVPVTGGTAPVATQTVKGIARQLSFNIKDFGPTGTADDAATLQAAINAAAAVNGVVYIPAGTYIVGTSLLVNATVSLVGEGKYTSIIKVKNNTNIFAFTLAAGGGATQLSSVHMRNLCIDGNNTNQTTGGGCISAQYLVHSSFAWCRFTNACEVGVWLQGATGGAFGHNNSFFGCLFDNGKFSTGTNNGQGLRTNSCDENFIVACDFEYNGSAGGANNFAVYDNSGTNFFTGVNFVNGANGYKLQSSPNSRLTGCHWDGVGGDAVQITSTGAVITGCTFSSPGFTATNTYSAIRVAFAGGGHTITGNQITTPATGAPFTTRSFYREGGATIPSLVANNTIISGSTGNTGYTSFGTALLEDGGIGTVYSLTGAALYSVQSQAANYTLTPLDATLIVTSGSHIMTLPAIATVPKGKTYTVTNSNMTNTTLATTSAQTINGATTYTLAAAYASVTVISDGTQWWVVSKI